MTARPRREEMLMAMARVASLRSSCSRASVGAVIAQEGRVISTGYNGAPKGLPHCNHDCNCNHSGTGPCVRCNGSGLELGGWMGGTRQRPDPDPCFECKGTKHGHAVSCNSQPCTNAVHAEANAIAFAARWGVRTEGAELFTTFCPCLPCAQLIVNAGIICVFYGKPYRVNDGLELLARARIGIVDWNDWLRYDD